MLDHISLPVTDFEKSKRFYLTALKPLGFKLGLKFSDACGMGPGNNEFWLVKKDNVSAPIHLAFQVENRKAVDKFHKEALKAGGKDNGAPGIRKEYAPNYYAAFIYDPDGHNIEVVCYKSGHKKNL